MPTDTSLPSNKLISIICRSIGRPELKQALGSIADQTYRTIEIILVEAGGESLNDFISFAGHVPVKLVSLNKKLARAAAANAGLAEVTGDFIMFLDDDDWIGENHVAHLVDTLNTYSDVKAAYSSTQKMSADGKDKKEVFDQEFDSRLLMRDNFIPIHSMLFESTLLKPDCRFDESFDIFEDWDFWLQLNQHTEFIHTSNLSAFYREGGDSETVSDEDYDRYQNHNPRGQGRAKLFEKWLKLWSGEQLNSLLGFLDQTNSIIELNSTIENLNCTVVSSGEHNEQLDKHILIVESQNESLQSDIGATKTHSQQLEKHILVVESQNESLQSDIGATRTHSQQLEKHILAVESQNESLQSDIGATRTHSQQLEKHILALDSQNESLQSDIGAARTHTQQLLESLDAEKVALASLRNLNLEKTQQLENSVNHAAALDTALRSILGSTSWRIMGPYRRVGRLLKRFLGFGKVDTRAPASLVQPIAQVESISPEPEAVYTHPLSFYVDKAITFNNCIYIRGWATKAPGIESIRLKTHNSSASVSYGILREDVQQTFPLVPNSDKSGFLAFAKFDFVGKTYLEFTDSDGVVSQKPVVLEQLEDASSLIASGEFINLSPDTQYTIFRALQQIKGLESIDSNKSFEYTPLVSIIVPVFNVEKRWLDACVESVLRQSYPNWELCLHDDASTEKETLDCLRHWQHQDSRIKVQYGDNNQHISGASNSALEIAMGEFIGLMDNDDELHVDALWHVIDTLNGDPDLDYIYTDEDKINSEGEFCEPHFKPDWSPELLESMMYVGHFGVIRRSVIDAVGGFRLGVEGSQDYDLTLRISQHTQRFAHIPRVLYHWRIIPGSVAGGGDAKSYAYTAAIKALTDYADKQPEPSKVTETELCGRYRIQRQSNNPDITIILPFHNKAEMTIDCLRSIGKSTYTNFKVLLISNNSEPAEYQKVADFSASFEYIELHQLNIPFNWSAINNWGVAQSTSEFVLFLNNDMTVINADWIEALMDCAVKEGVGAVGAKLLFEDNTVQHFGVVMGLGGIASHAFKHIDGDDPGYFGYAAVVRNCSAVTGACMLVRRSVVNQIEGFNEDLKVAYNDVDFCLRLREAKLKVLITPFAKLYHLESKTRPKFLDDMNSAQLAQFESESGYIRERHAKYFSEGDPYYNKALSLRIENYSLRV